MESLEIILDQKSPNIIQRDPKIARLLETPFSEMHIMASIPILSNDKNKDATKENQILQSTERQQVTLFTIRLFNNGLLTLSVFILIYRNLIELISLIFVKKIKFIEWKFKIKFMILEWKMYQSH